MPTRNYLHLESAFYRPFATADVALIAETSVPNRPIVRTSINFSLVRLKNHLRLFNAKSPMTSSRR